MSAITISLSGLLSAKAQLMASASNVANARTQGALDGGLPKPYRPIVVIQTPQPPPSAGVVITYARSPAPPPVSYQPASPMADGRGMVAGSGVDLAQEAVNQALAMESFRANLAVLRTAQEMDKTLLNLKV